MTVAMGGQKTLAIDKISVVVLDVSRVRSPTLPTPVTSPGSSRNDGPTPFPSISPAEVYPNGRDSAER